MKKIGQVTGLVQGIAKDNTQLIKRHEQKTEMISIPEIQEGLSAKEMILAEAGTDKPIRLVEDGELVRKLSALTQVICRDIGIIKWNNQEEMKYSATRFLDILKKYYSELTLREVKVAFEMCAIGELDKFLPKRDGMADKNHYQSFSIDYITKVLIAYKARKNQVWSKVNNLLPVATKTATAEEKRQYRESFINTINQGFDNYKNNGVIPHFIAPGMVVKELVKCRLLPEDQKPTDAQLRKALYETLTGNTNKFQKAFIHQKGKDHEKVIVAANRLAQEENILKVFKELVTKHLHINKFIEK